MNDVKVKSTEFLNDEWREFLSNRPVGAETQVDERILKLSDTGPFPTAPALKLFCETCKRYSYCKGSGGIRCKIFVGVQANYYASRRPPFDVNLSYICECCDADVKSYVVRFWSTERAQKLAEWPPFAPRTPSKLTSLIGPDRELFLKGRRAELEGLGIGAFSYYRRVVENQKNRFLDAIIRVARHINASEDVTNKLEKAKAESQFSKAVENVRSVIPSELYIKGHNPLTLLHSALSEGLHNESDEACLHAATDVRIILVEFASRLSESMSEQKELDEALSRLLNRKNSQNN